MPSANFYDYETEAESVKNQQAIVNAMRQQASAPSLLPMSVGVGAVQPKINPLELVVKALQTGLARKGESEAEAKKRALAERYTADLRNGLEQFQQTSEGQPAITLPPDQAGPVMPGVAGDPRKAVLDALGSNHPVLQKLAMDRMNAKANVLDLDKLAGMATPESVIANPQDPSKWQPKRELKAVAPGEILVDASGNLAQPGGNPQNGWRTVNIGGDLYQQTATGLKKLDNAPKISVSNTMPAISLGQKAGAMEYFKGAAKQVETLGQEAGSSQELLNTLGTLKELHNAGINSNITSDVATTLQNLGQRLGVKVDAKTLGNTETYNSLITDLWQRSVSQYGGNRGVTAAEAEQIKKLTPLASTSPQAREQLFAIMENKAKRSIDKYRQANRSFAQAAQADDPTMFQIPDDIENAHLPQAGFSPNPGVTGGQPRVMSLDEYLKGVQ